MKWTLFICMLLAGSFVQGASFLLDEEPVQGNVIFVHPDGCSVAHWGAARMMWAGPDGFLEWDRMPHMGVYRGHMEDAMAATSHGGATVHAYGRKVDADSYGMDHHTPLTSLSGKQMSIMQEALAAGKSVGIINSGHLNEPGTGCFLASSPSRNMSQFIVEQIMKSGAQVIMAGGEGDLLPAGTIGRHGPGQREDGLDLIQIAQSNGYSVVYTKEELNQLSKDVDRILGVFAHAHTFYDLPEEELRTQGLPFYNPDAPTVAEMMDVALPVLARNPGGFLLVAEEEATDNFSNVLNAPGALEALRRGDAALGVGRKWVHAHSDTLLLTAADSCASGLEVVAPHSRSEAWFPPDAPLPPTTLEGAPLDGVDGTGTLPFITAPDQAGRRHPFGIAWIGRDDTAGGILARAEGVNAEHLSGNCDNTDIYRLMYRTLFGCRLPE